MSDFVEGIIRHSLVKQPLPVEQFTSIHRNAHHVFEPHAAEAVFEDWIRRYKIPVDRDQWLDRSVGVRRKAGRIVSIRMLSGKSYEGRMFIDAT